MTIRRFPRTTPPSLTPEWIVGRRQAAFYVTTPAPPYRPDLLFCLDVESRQVIAAEVVHPATSDDAAADRLAAAFREAAPQGASPQARTDSEALAAALRRVVPQGVAVVVGPAPEIDAVAGAVAEARLADNEPDYLEGGSVPEPLVRGFFESASRLYRAAPWKKIKSDSQLVRLEAEWAGFPDGCVSIVGTLGENLGLAVLESVGDFREFARLVDEGPPGEGEWRGPGVPMLSLHVDPAKELPSALRAQVKKHRWPVAGTRAYPRLLRLDPDGVGRPLTGLDYTLAAGLADAVVDLVEKHSDVFGRDDPQAVTVERNIEHEGSSVALRLTAPCPGLDWHWLDGNATEAVRLEELAAILDEYRQAAGHGHPAAGDDAAEDVLERLLEFKIDAFDEPPLGWTADQVEAFLLDIFPASIVLDGEAALRTPARLGHFFSWLSAQEYEDPNQVDEIRARIRRVTPEFEKRALDRSRYRPIKTIALEMRREGVDGSDRAAVDRFMHAFNERLKADPDLLPMPLVGRGGKPLRTRWAPAPGEAAPAPTAPCPCGSGRRYKKCCLPR